MKIKLQDWINKVKKSPIKKKIQGLICKYSEKSTLSVKKPNHSFINEKARNIIQKLSRNLLTVMSFGQRERKLNHIAHAKTKGNATFATFKLNHTIHNNDVVIHVPTLAHSITANADVSDKIHVPTNANTSTETTFELSNIVVINIPLQKDLNTEDVNFFSRFLNHPFVIEEIACSK